LKYYMTLWGQKNLLLAISGFCPRLMLKYYITKEVNRVSDTKFMCSAIIPHFGVKVTSSLALFRLSMAQCDWKKESNTVVFTCTLLVRMKNQKYGNDLCLNCFDTKWENKFHWIFLPFPISLTLISCGTIASNVAGWAGFLFGNVYAPLQKGVSRDCCNKIPTTGNSLFWVCVSSNVINVWG
jgi:hypothetical protein